MPCHQGLLAPDARMQYAQAHHCQHAMTANSHCRQFMHLALLHSSAACQAKRLGGLAYGIVGQLQRSLQMFSSLGTSKYPPGCMNSHPHQWAHSLWQHATMVTLAQICLPLSESGPAFFHSTAQSPAACLSIKVFAIRFWHVGRACGPRNKQALSPQYLSELSASDQNCISVIKTLS